MNRIRLIALVSVLAILAVIAATLYWKPAFLYGPAQRTEIKLVLAWDNASDEPAIVRELKEFESLFPAWKTVASSQKPADLILGLQKGTISPLPEIFMTPASTTMDPSRLGAPPAAWTGSSWGLYYNAVVLRKIGIDPARLPPGSIRLLPELADRAGMEKVFGALKSGGIVPIAVGSLYGWPEAAWLQHIEAFLEGPDKAEQMAAGLKTATDPEWTAAVALWKDWDRAGYLGPDWKKKDWPESVIAFAEGKAAFCLLNDQLLSTIPVARRQDIGFINFPVGSHGNWEIGSIWYLDLAAKPSRGAENLFNYLTSPGVTQRLARTMNRPFFSSETALRMIPSITNNNQAPFIQSLLKANVP